jgi:acetylornithine deacetylase/succinyl-diaminopimelate desuccinylase-like protein
MMFTWKFLAVVVCVAATIAPPASAQVVLPDVTKELAEVRELLATDEMKQALAYVERLQKDPADLLQEWIGICEAYAPEGDEIYRSRHLYRLFKEYGLEYVHIDDEMNVIGVRPGTGGGPKLVLTAHHDTVALWPRDQPIHAYIADQRVWCPGASDDLVGVVQMLTVLRALNAAKVQTKGDLWFVTFTGEERGSRGAHYFVASHHPVNLDWRRGDALMQFHGGGGEGVSSGSDPVYLQTKLRVFTPFERNDPALGAGIDRRWLPHAVDALAQIMVRVRKEIWDSRTFSVDFRDPGMETKPPVLFLNMAKVEGIPIMNAPASEASVLFDLRSKSPERTNQANADIQRIAGEVCATFPKEIPCRYMYEVVRRSGLPDGIPGFDRANNRGALLAAAASHVLYNTKPFVDPSQGCGDCIAAYMEGMPMMSLRGRVEDLGGGQVRMGSGAQVGELRSETRRRTTGHDITQSAEISSVWAAAKHGLAFAAAFVGVAR